MQPHLTLSKQTCCHAYTKALFDLLQQENTNPSALNENGDAPLHSIVKSDRQDKVELLVTLLTHSMADVNMMVANGMTALHFAAQVSPAS